MTRSTKIVATLGPATDSTDTLKALIAAGLDVARLNCSHGRADDHRRRASEVRRCAAEAGRPVAVLFDIQGPKLRLGDITEGTRRLEQGESIVFRAPGQPLKEPAHLPIGFDLNEANVQVGDRVLLFDGRVTTRVTRIDEAGVHAGVEVGGEVSSRKGVNLPDTEVTLPRLTDKDLADLALAVDEKADWVAISFVETAADILAVRAIIGDDISIVAKIERPRAVECIDEILEVTDAIMVARGDLGVELPFAQVPVIQKALIAAANRRGVPAITATEMLESMIGSARPTRAEASDVANAVLDGTDAVMLSAETASGDNPVAAVEAMAAIILGVEEPSRALLQGIEPHHQVFVENPFAAAIASAAVKIARDLQVNTIATFTETGRSARLIAAAHPGANIVAFTPNRQVLARLALYRGVQPKPIAKAELSSVLMAAASEVLLREGIAEPGETVIFVAGPAGITNGTNFIRLARIEHQQQQ